MQRALIAFLLLACMAGPALAPPRSRIYVSNLEYKGPWVLSGDVVLVDLKAFVRAMGWVEHDRGAALCVAAKAHANCPVPDDASGVWLEGKHFNGLVRRDNDEVLVSLQDLAKALGGDVRINGDLQIVQATIPGMPGSSTTNPAEMLKAQIQSKPFTLVQFYVEADPYCDRLKPHVKTFLTRHAAVLRGVVVEMPNAGPNWIYGNFKSLNAGVPELVLVNSKGVVLQKLVGETDANGLEKELSGFLKSP